ncbi:hypothetical protein ACS0TY_033774 [Phlomoides rotata]
MIEIEDEAVWESCKRCVEIFGKDRATGENVVDPIDLVNEMDHCEGEQGETGDKAAEVNVEGQPILEDNSICKPNKLRLLASKNENKELNNIMRGISGLKVGDKLKVCDELV